MSTHGYIAEYFIDDIDSFTLEEQYRLLHDLPDGRFVAPGVKRRMFLTGETASEALKHVRRLLPLPFSPNALPPMLYGAPSLIDEERWHEARAKLRSQGAVLPCDYMFGDRHWMAESFDSDETIRSGGVDAHGRLDSAEWTEEDIPLLIAGQDQIAIQSHGAIIWQLLIDFGKAIRRMLARLLTSR